MAIKAGPIAIDFGFHAVRMMQMAGAANRFRVAVQDSHVHRTRPRGEALHAAEMVESVRAMLRRRRFRGKAVVTALPVKDLMVKNIRLPQMPEEEMETAVRFEALDRIAGLDADAEVRFAPAGSLPGRDDGQQEVIVFAARGESVRAHLHMIDALGLESVGIDVPSLAALRPFLRKLRRGQDREHVTALADLGRAGMRFTIARGAQATFTKFFDLAAEKIDWDQLGKEIGLCLRYHAVTFRGQRPEQVTCVGGEALDAAALEFLSHAVGTPCRIGRPLLAAGAQDENMAESQDSGAEWATVTGLAMKTVRRGRSGTAA